MIWRWLKVYKWMEIGYVEILHHFKWGTLQNHIYRFKNSLKIALSGFSQLKRPCSWNQNFQSSMLVFLNHGFLDFKLVNVCRCLHLHESPQKGWCVVMLIFFISRALDIKAQNSVLHPPLWDWGVALIYSWMAESLSREPEELFLSRWNQCSLTEGSIKK